MEPAHPLNINATTIFQGIESLAAWTVPEPCATAIWRYQTLPTRSSIDLRGCTRPDVASVLPPNSLFLNQNYLADGLPLLGSSRLAIRRAKNFVYAYSQQANLSI